jgi:hypothetical protein
MSLLFLASVFLQGAAITFDEFHFHWKRNLPQWERIGHPVDSVSLLIPIGFLAFAQRTPAFENAYILFSILSCLCITKDEWIHHEHSEPSENWLHSVLFILHPVVLISGYFVWGTLELPVQLFFYSVLCFTLYQIIFWNFYADRLLKGRLQAHQ